MTDTDDEIDDLIEIAGTPASDKRPRSELVWALNAARSLDHAAGQRGTADEHNAPVDEVERAAAALEQALKALRRQPNAHGAFWEYGTPDHAEAGFGLVCGGEIERGGVFPMLGKIGNAARDARVQRKGRTPALGKERVVKMAWIWFDRFAHKNCKQSRPKFVEFAERFYQAAFHTTDAKLDRQIAKVWSSQNELPC